LTSIITGIDYLEQTILEVRRQVHSVISLRSSSSAVVAAPITAKLDDDWNIVSNRMDEIQSCLVSLRSVYELSLAVVNRSTDYYKATLGAELVPKLEWIVIHPLLLETITLMQAISTSPIVLHWNIPSTIMDYNNNSQNSSFSKALVVPITESSKNAETTKLHKYSPQLSRNNIEIQDIEDTNNNNPHYYHHKQTTTETEAQKTFSLYTDKQWLRENILCLISNAVKYSNGKEIHLKVELAPGAANHHVMNGNDENHSFFRISVIDQGVLLTEQQLEKFFIMHGSQKVSSRSRTGGIGLGLYSLACRVDALGGHYGAKGNNCVINDEKSMMIGTEVWFTLPLPLPNSSSFHSSSHVSSSSSSLIIPVLPLLPSSTSSSHKPMQRNYSYTILQPNKQQSVGVIESKKNKQHIYAVSSGSIKWKDAGAGAGGEEEGSDSEKEKKDLFVMDNSSKLNHTFCQESHSEKEGEEEEDVSSPRIASNPYHHRLLSTPTIPLTTSTSVSHLITQPSPTFASLANHHPHHHSHQHQRHQQHPYHMLSDSALIDLEEGGGKGNALLSSSDEEYYSQSHHILIVDDSPAILKMLTMLFTKQGYQVTTALHGQAAVDCILLQQNHQTTVPIESESVKKKGAKIIDTVLIDIQMPIMNGLEAIQHIRAIEGQHQTLLKEGEEATIKPLIIIAMSANTEFATYQEALSSGANSFLQKPFTMESFQVLMASIIANNNRNITNTNNITPSNKLVHIPSQHHHQHHQGEQQSVHSIQNSITIPHNHYHHQQQQHRRPSNGATVSFHASTNSHKTMHLYHNNNTHTHYQ